MLLLLQTGKFCLELISADHAYSVPKAGSETTKNGVHTLSFDEQDSWGVGKVMADQIIL